jgi:hypothetical protein
MRWNASFVEPSLLGRFPDPEQKQTGKLGSTGATGR